MSVGRVSLPNGDAQVIEASWDEPERFAMIYDRHFVSVHRYVARRVGVPAADDIAAEVFLIAFDQRKRFDVTRDTAQPWLFGIATNLISMHRRKERRFLAALARSDPGPAWHDEETRMTERLSAAAARPALAAAVADLAPADRDVLLLVVLAGLGHQEVADALGIPYGTVGSRLNRARKRLRESLGGVNPAGNWTKASL